MRPPLNTGEIFVFGSDPSLTTGSFNEAPR